MAKLVIPAAGCKSGCGKTPSSVHSGCGKTAPTEGACGMQYADGGVFARNLARDIAVAGRLIRSATASTDGAELMGLLRSSLKLSEGHNAAIIAAPEGLVPVITDAPEEDPRSESSWEKHAFACGYMTSEEIRDHSWTFERADCWTVEQKRKFVLELCGSIKRRAKDLSGSLELRQEILDEQAA